jgi:hypothetical protein
VKVFGHRPLTNGFKLGAAKCAQIVRNIEEALFAWTPEQYEQLEQQVPVNRVVFLDLP